MIKNDTSKVQGATSSTSSSQSSGQNGVTQGEGSPRAFWGCMGWLINLQVWFANFFFRSIADRTVETQDTQSSATSSSTEQASDSESEEEEVVTRTQTGESESSDDNPDSLDAAPSDPITSEPCALGKQEPQLKYGEYYFVSIDGLIDFFDSLQDEKSPNTITVGINSTETINGLNGPKLNELLNRHPEITVLSMKGITIGKGYTFPLPLYVKELSLGTIEGIININEELALETLTFNKLSSTGEIEVNKIGVTLRYCEDKDDFHIKSHKDKKSSTVYIDSFNDSDGDDDMPFQLFD